jgi:hypothetical protein
MPLLAPYSIEGVLSAHANDHIGQFAHNDIPLTSKAKV